MAGHIPVNGAKNAALKVLAASILFKDEIALENIPLIEDIKRMCELLGELGMEVKEKGRRSFTVRPGAKIATELPAELSQKFRASIVLAGPILSRYGTVTFFFPGGCLIGKRPVDFFIEGFEKMGARVRVSAHGDSVKYLIETKARRLMGTEIFLRAPSVTATETFILSGILASGETVIKNAAMEPEIVSLSNYLSACGAKIRGVGTPTIRIKGGPCLESRGLKYRTLPDRIEAGSFIILGALCARDLTVTDCNPLDLEALLSVLSHAGVNFKTGKDWVRIINKNGAKIPFKAFNIKTQGYPGFPTDLQALITLFLTQSRGDGAVFETIFESRLEYIKSLREMGAKIRVTENQAFIRGPTALRATNLESRDLRAGMAFILAAIIAKGTSLVHNVYNIDRGYEKVEERLAKVGVDIQRCVSS